MNNKRILARLSQLTPEVRNLAEIELREAGLLAQGAPLEEAFPTSSETRDEACDDRCGDAYDKALENCKTDACRMGAVVAYKRCLRKCAEA
jgi:hypothetical protein